MEKRKLMPKPDRFNLLLRITECQDYVDVLNQAAVDKYTEVTGASYKTMPFGANQCRLMGRDLSEMERDGLLERHRSGIADGLCHMGYPRWVWVYRLTDLGRDRLNEVLPGRQPIAS